MGFTLFDDKQGCFNENVDDDVVSLSSNEVGSDDDDDDDNSNSSMEDHEVNSSSLSSSPDSPFSYSTSSPDGKLSGADDSLGDMSALLQQLPFKRGLSKHYQGKSQSFTSLSNVMCLEDLAKPENPYNKRLKSCKSYMGLSNDHMMKQLLPKSSSSRQISKKTSRGSCSSLINNYGRRINNNTATNNSVGGSLLGNNRERPPIHPPLGSNK